METEKQEKTEELEEKILEGDAPLSEEELLDDLLAAVDAQEVQYVQPNKAFSEGITTDLQAEYFIRRYKELEEEYNNIENLAGTQINQYKFRVTKWREKKQAEILPAMEYIKNMLQHYAEKTISGKLRSRKFVTGTIGFTKQRDEYERNDEKIRHYLLKMGDEGSAFLEHVPEKVKWNELKKASTVDENGILRYAGRSIPGVVVCKRPDKFTVK